MGLAGEVPVIVPLGDNQASLYATIEDEERDIALSIGAGGQLSVIIPQISKVNFALPRSVDLRPYPGKKLAAVGASLCGTTAFEWLVRSVGDWCSDLGVSKPTPDEIAWKLDSLGMKHLDTPIRFSSSFMGERHDPGKMGDITQLTLHNSSLGNLSAALARDIVENLRSMLPEQFLEGRARVVGSGVGLRKFPLMRKMTERLFGLPLILSDTVEEAASGAGLFAYRALKEGAVPLPSSVQQHTVVNS